MNLASVVDQVNSIVTGIERLSESLWAITIYSDKVISLQLT